MQANWKKIKAFIFFIKIFKVAKALKKQKEI